MTTRQAAIYDRELKVRVTRQMDEFLNSLAQRERISKAAIVRQAIRDHLDVQEDVIGSRSRLGTRVLSRLEIMQHRFLRQLVHLGKLMLAAIIVLLSEQDVDIKSAISQIADLAAGSELDRIVKLEE